MQYVVKSGLSIYDIAVLLYGDAQLSIKLCNDNNITITDNIDGLTLTYNENIKAQQITNNKAKNPMNANNLFSITLKIKNIIASFETIEQKAKAQLTVKKLAGKICKNICKK